MAVLCTEDSGLKVTALVHELPAAHDEYRVRSLIGTMAREGMVMLDEEADEVRL